MKTLRTKKKIEYVRLDDQLKCAFCEEVCVLYVFLGQPCWWTYNGQWCSARCFHASTGAANWLEAQRDFLFKTYGLKGRW